VSVKRANESPDLSPAATSAVTNREVHPAEREGWFTVQRAAHLLEIPIPRVFDRIRDGKLQVRFEAGKPGESDRPFVSSMELKQKAIPTGPANASGAAVYSPAPEVRAEAAADPRSAPRTEAEKSPPAARPPPALDPALLDEARRVIGGLEEELTEARESLEESDAKVDTALKAVYERDVKIARLEAEVAAHSKVREEAEQFIRHLEIRLDKQEDRSDEKEKEMRRLALGLGEARGEIRLLTPPAPEPPPAWKRHLSGAGVLLIAAGGATLVFWVAWQLALKGLGREAGLLAGAATLLAFAVGWVLDRVRRSK
jgi:hypothetical protein